MPRTQPLELAIYSHSDLLPLSFLLRYIVGWRTISKDTVAALQNELRRQRWGNLARQSRM